MKINVGIREDGQEILFVTDSKDNNIGELEISKEYFKASLKELDEQSMQVIESQGLMNEYELKVILEEQYKSLAAESKACLHEELKPITEAMILIYDILKRTRHCNDEGQSTSKI